MGIYDVVCVFGQHICHIISECTQISLVLVRQAPVQFVGVVQEVHL